MPSSTSSRMYSGIPMLRRGEACAECRRRKLRCDGAKPFCTICVKANRECKYEKPVTRPVYIVLQERLALLEHRFQTLRDEAALLPPASPINPTSNAPSTGAAGFAAGEGFPDAFDAMAVAMNQPLYSAAGGRWYNAEILAAPHRNFLINIFLQHHASLPFDLHVPTFIARLHSANPAERPHPAIIESMYLMACYFVSRGLAPPSGPLALEVSADPGVELPQLAELPQLEEHFLRRARSALVDSLSFSDRLMDFLRGSILVTQYLYLRGRFLEGANNVAGPGSQFAGSPSAVLLAPPANQLEVAERIKTFWMIYFCDKMSSICAGFFGALPGEGDAVEAITTVFPRRYEEYESGVANEAYNDTLGDLFGGVRPMTGDRLPDIPWTVGLKGVSLLVRATRIGLNYRIRPTSETVHTVQGLKVAIDNFRSTLEPLKFSGHTTAPIPGTSCKDSGTLLGHTAALGALMEVHHTLLEATDSDEDYDARLAHAVEVAELASSVKDGRLANGTLICAGYCWALAARILVRHIESNDGTEPYAVDYESHLANLVTALEMLSVTFPALRRGELKNLKLKKGALDRLRLPVDVAEGHLGRFILEIPGTQILSSPCKITIEDLYLLVVPSAGRQHDPDEDEKRMQAAKQERLDSYETLQAESVAATQLQAGTGDEKTQTAMEIAMTQRIADNLQVYVKNIHIRYEDNVSCPGHPFAAGITLGSFQVETTDKNWMQAFITEKLQSIELHKLAQLKSLAVYFDTDEKSISGLSVEESKTTFKSLISADGRNPSHQYILRPVSGEARLIFNRRVTNTIPRFDANLTFDDLSFNLDDAQYRDAISMLDMYHFFTRQAQYRRFRPSDQETQENSKLAMLKFANPLDKHADSGLVVRLRALEIVYHKGYIETVFRFFRPPESQLESVAALLSAASETLGEIRNQSRAGLEYALQKHKTIDIELDMQAPIIIIPEDVRTQSGQHMVLDAGHISVRSDLVPKSDILAIQSKRKRQYTDKDFEELESLMYDKFFLQLQSAQLVLGKDLESCLNALTSANEGRELHLLERINMEFSVQMSIIPDAPNLTRFKVAGTLPLLNVNFSNTKYKGIMRFVDISIPNFDGDTTDTPQARPSTTPAITSATRPDPFQLPSNFFRSTDVYLIDDADRSTIAGEEDSDGEETFVDAENGSIELSRSTVIKQHTFEFSFKVEKLQASLYKDEGNGTPEKLLAELQLYRFDLDFALAKFDMQVDISLNSLSVHMVDQPGHRVPMILSSRTETSEVKGAETGNDDLVKVRYFRVQRNSPEFHTVYEGIDQSVTASLSTLVVHAAPEPIIVLYDFIMTTFVPGHGSSETNTPVAADSPSGEPLPPPAVDSGKIRVRVNLTTVEVLLIDNNRQLATLDLSAAEVAILLRGNTMRIGAQLGNLSIVDDSPLIVQNADFKKIVSIEGDQLADFTYETFDPHEKETFPGVNSLVHLRFASLKTTFIEAPVRDIYQWLIKFARMKALYDAATQAAVQRASEISRMKFDIVVKSPIVVIPRDASNSPDVLVMKLGEIFANNSYSGPVATTSAGLRGIRLTSHFHYGNDVANLRMIDDVEISTRVVQTENIDRNQNLQEPDTVVDVTISDVKLALTQAQYILIVQLSQAIPRVLAVAPGAEKAADEASSAPSPPPTPAPAVDDSEPKVDLTPELGLTAHTESGQEVLLWSSIDVAVNVKAVRLQLFDRRATLETTLRESGIVRCSLTDSQVRFKMLSDGATQTEITLKSFTINNTRAGSSRFREIIPAAQHNRNQFTVLYSTAGSSDPSATAVILIDSPKVLFTVEPVFALLEFFQSPFAQAQPSSADVHDESAKASSELEPTTNQSALTVRLDMHDVSVSVLERDDDPNTQAIQLTVKEINLAQQSITSLAVKKMGMSLMSMNKPADKVSFLDEIDVTLTIDGRQTTDHEMTEIGLNILPIVFRASLRDITLITAIVNRALELSSSQAASQPTPPKPISARPPSAVSKRSGPSSRPKASTKGKSRVIMSKEMLNATLEGFRLVLIGDLHELPLLHLNTTSITLRASDWSSELQATASLTTSITYWNLTNSHWEPLIDPWHLSLSAHKDSITGALTLGLTSKERLDLNLTTTFIDLALSTAAIWSKEGERLMKKARGGDAPYRIFNRTGTPLQLWSDVDDKSKGGSQMQPAQLDDGAFTEWRFDDWRTMRDRVSSSSRTNSIVVQFQNKPWDAIRAIPVDREGEFVYALRPRTQKTADRLLCEVTVKDNVKHVTLRSTYKLENNTLYPIDVVLVDSRGRPSHQLKKLSPGEDYVVPIEAVLLSDIQVRPDPGFGYSWAERPIKWHDLVSDPAQTVTCPYKEGGGEFPFRFQAWASYDLNDSINRYVVVTGAFVPLPTYHVDRAYPKMTVRLRAPIELENLLPYDIKYRIYDTTSRRTWTSYLRRGGLMPIHCVHLDQCVMFSAEIQETNYKPSDFSVINSDGSPDIPVESVLRVEDKQERKLDLRINYTKYEESGGAFRMQIYSPFVAINKTGFPLNIKCRNGKPVAGQVENPNLAEATPFMFSHTKEQGAEFVFRLGDTAWSNGLNFEAPSAETAVALGSPAPSTKETHVGVSWTSGLGKYKLTKVVTFAPRFVLKNELGRDIVFRESGDPGNDAPLRAGSFTPIFALSARREAALAFKYPGVGSKWCPPVNIQDLGVVHAKLPTSDEDKPDLARVEDAPLSPKYKLEPHSQIRYAWDYPAARQKELVLRMGDGEESVNLNEIGDLLPFRFKTSSGWRVVSRDIHAEDEVTVLTISNWVEETSVYKRHGRSATMDSTISRADTVSSQAAEVGFTAVVKDVSPSLVVKIDFDGIGLSLMNRRLLEVVYLTLSKLQVTYTDSEIARDIDLTCGWVQIDNQLHEAIYPIVLQPLPLTQDRDAKTVWNTVETKLTLVKDEAHGVVFIKYFGILLQALSIQTDEDFLFALLDLTKLQAASWEKEETEYASRDEAPPAAPLTPIFSAFSDYPKELAPPRAIERGTTLYFEELDLNPIRLALSFARTERVNADEKLTLRNPLAVLVNALAMTLGNVNDAPLKLNGLLLRDTLLTVPGLQERIVYHYKNEVLRQVYRILGSADFIGNPVGLFTNVASGVADIITEPWQSVLNHGSRELGIGIAKGAASFAKKTVFSVSDSLTKVTGSVGKGFANATFDAEFQRQRRLAQRRNRPGNAIYGVQSGGEALVTSFASGLEGIVSKPLEGAERDGAIGFFKGIGKGFVGAFTKPAVGIFDLASNLAEGVRNTTTVFDNNNQSRKRIPRHTPADGILTPYSQREALGQAWMKDLNNGAYRAEFYYAHIAVQNSDVVVMLTSGHVLGFYSTKLRLKFEIPLSLIKKVSTSETGIIFANSAGTEYDQFVLIPEKASRDWFFKEIDK
ncbi:hypothetical protein FRC01_005870 [Tulasnella sp. 417]|nr:hypothetical protein FRC01_005870 [Tulasnella sp. 417]